MKQATAATHSLRAKKKELFKHTKPQGITGTHCLQSQEQMEYQEQISSTSMKHVEPWQPLTP